MMLNTMAEKPKIMTISLKNGIRKATSLPENAGPFDSIEIKDLKILSPK